jgi:hypothetical protein
MILVSVPPLLESRTLQSRGRARIGSARSPVCHLDSESLKSRRCQSLGAACVATRGRSGAASQRFDEAVEAEAGMTSSVPPPLRTDDFQPASVLRSISTFMRSCATTSNGLAAFMRAIEIALHADPPAISAGHGDFVRFGDHFRKQIRSDSHARGYVRYPG